jgi:hypothetical protein
VPAKAGEFDSRAEVEVTAGSCRPSSGWRGGAAVSGLACGYGRPLLAFGPWRNVHVSAAPKVVDRWRISLNWLKDRPALRRVVLAQSVREGIWSTGRRRPKRQHVHGGGLVGVVDRLH